MSKFVVGNLFLGLSILLQSSSQVIMKTLMTELDTSEGLVAKIRQLMVATRFWRAGLAGTMIVVAFLAWLMCLSKLDLSYAYPIACGSAFLVTILSVVFLGETATPKMWVGTVLIMIGTVLLAPSK